MPRLGFYFWGSLSVPGFSLTLLVRLMLCTSGSECHVSLDAVVLVLEEFVY